MPNIVNLPVSIGEALDKLSILYIKLENIKDKRRENVFKEYTLLYDKLEIYLSSFEKYYKMLKKINLHIWKLMDILRDNDKIDDLEYLKISKETILGNDIRFRIKSKINNITNSSFKEEKGYKILRVLIDISEYNKDINLLIKPLYYYLINYDKLYLITNNHTHVNCIFNEFKNEIYILDKPTYEEMRNDNILKFIKTYKIPDIDNKTDIYNILELSDIIIEKYI
jgi:hypothetical protein